MDSPAPLTFSAKWVVPIVGDPIRDGHVSIDRSGRILSVGRGRPPHATVLSDVVLLPALVNAHTHIELSYLHGRVPPSDSFNDWVMTLMSLRRTFPDPYAAVIVDRAHHAVGQARASGTGLIGDVSNTLATLDALTEASMPAHVFHELIGFSAADVAVRIAKAREAIETPSLGNDLRVGLAPHAPYSVSPGLFTAIRREVDAHPHPITSVHLGESAAEVELLKTGTGPARTMLERLGVWSDAWTPPGVSPVSYLADIGFIDARTLIVHGVQFDARDLARIRAIGATLVSCPRSNVYVGVGSPPLAAFYDAGVHVALGTDSLASVADLNMFHELAEARRIAPRVSARQLLESATLTGARALGFDKEFGSIEAGKRAALLAVRVPAQVVDVEEYLVGGVELEAISWLRTDAQRPTPNSQPKSG